MYKELVVQLWGCFSRCHAKLAIKIQLSVRKYMRFAWSGDTRLFHSGDGEEAWDRSVEEPRFIRLERHNGGELETIYARVQLWAGW